MKNRHLLFLLLGILALTALVWFAIPSGAGIKSQMNTLFATLGGGAVFVVGWILAIVFWIFEAGALFAGPIVLGVLSEKVAIPWLDEKFSPDVDITGWQEFALTAVLAVFVFVFWLVVPLVVAWAPPANSFILGEWIHGHVETGLVWWGVYASLAYFICHWMSKIDWSEVLYP